MILHGTNTLPIWGYSRRRMPDGYVRRMLDLGAYWIAWYQR